LLDDALGYLLPSLPADFGNKVKIDLAGLTPAQIDEKLKEAVVAGEEMPRAHWQSVEPLRLPTVVE
jgi:hypothetical protein